MRPPVRCLVSNWSLRVRGAVDLFEVNRLVDGYVEHRIQEIDIDHLDGWNILIMVTVRDTDNIRVFKRARRYPSDKEFEFSISVPAPEEGVAPYGLSRESSDFFLPVGEEKFHVIIPEYSRYGDIKEYFVESIKLAIDRLFEVGITCHGRKVRFRQIDG